MIDEYYEVWKVPTDGLIHGAWAEIGIYPQGSLLASCRTEERAEEIKGILEQDSPVERFGETVDDEPYEFVINTREFEEVKDESLEESG